MHVDSKGKVLASGGTTKKFDRFGMGALTGFEMALDGLRFKGFDGFKFKDFIKIKCTGKREPEPGQSPMFEFKVFVDRQDANTPKVGGTDKSFDNTNEPPVREQPPHDSW